MLDSVFQSAVARRPGRHRGDRRSWDQMVGMRNVMVHEYDEVDLGIVWDTAQRDLPPLVAALEAVLPPDES